jgi:hypothetical protein
MGYRYNHPPTWPQAPDGWTPPAGWQPDPTWPPAPPGWQFWVETEAQPAPSAPAANGWQAQPLQTNGTAVVGAAHQPQFAPLDRTRPASGSLFGRRKIAEAEAQQARTQLESAQDELTALRSQNAQLVADHAAVAAELARVRGLDAVRLDAEIRAARNELAQLQLSVDRDRAQYAVEATRQMEETRRAISEAKQKAEAELQAAISSRDAARAASAYAEADLLQLKARIVVAQDTAILQEVGVYEYHHVLADAVAYKSVLADLTDKTKTTAAKGNAVHGDTNWTVNGSATQGRKMVSDFSKLMLRAYNAEADYAVRSMRPHKLHSLTDRLDKSRATIARLGTTMKIAITEEYHRLRIRELELTADFLAKQEEEKERRRELRESQREEEKLQREIARERARLAKERDQYLGALARARASGVQDLQTAADLESKLAEIDSAMLAVDAREANIRAGYVYVISNLGAFGDRVVKIGMTRRLEPMDRVNELGDASVPFRFDVHALIFSEDAVGLERKLHREFEAKRVNQVNLRREFFYATPADVRDVLARLDGQHLLEFHEDAEALEWRASQKPKPTSAELNAQVS